MTLGIPRPLDNELPAAYADRVGQWYMSWNKTNKKLGQFFTPLSVARFMARLLPVGNERLRLLDPGAGLGILSAALCEVSDRDIELVAYEIDAEIADYLDACLSYTQTWMKTKNRTLQYRVVRDDFVLAHAKTLYESSDQLHDAVICNPPYFKLSKNDPRAQAAEIVVYGQPNIYALFMAVSAAILRPGGYAVYITPRSYAAGPYFSRFRDYFFSYMRPRTIHLFESRDDVFEEVLQESMILLAERSGYDSDILLSSSVADTDLGVMSKRITSVAQVVGKDNILRLPLTEQDREIAELVNSWTGNLHKYNMEISTGPVVPFRASHLVTSAGEVPATHAPLLWMQNIKPMRCEWPQQHKGQYLVLKGADKLVLPNQNYVLLRRFSAKEERQRLTAAPYFANLNTPVIGLENHLNYIYRPKGQLLDDETRGLALLLNSDLINQYFRTFSGSTQVNAAEIRSLPLPPLDAIIEMGRLAAGKNFNGTDPVATVLGIYA
ncbi:MAG: Eco57I restriction-modification methylase domain-containing protein [Chloroflexi bacterium]|nr:Eco57I restriction-modification methylase domain-containing protein [Chloroflexota bacterium]